MLQRVDADGSGNIDFAEFSKQAALKLQLVAQGLRKESEEETAEKFFEPQNAKALSMLNSEGTIAQMRQDPALKGRSKHIQDRMSRSGEWFNFGLPSKAVDNDDLLMILSKEKEAKLHHQKMKILLEAADTSGDGAAQSPLLG